MNPGARLAQRATSFLASPVARQPTPLRTIMFPDIPLDPITKEAARLLSKSDPAELSKSRFKAEVLTQMLELDEAIASMQTQLGDSGRTDPLWRKQCEFNLRLARRARSSLNSAVQCIAATVKELEKSRRVEMELRDREQARAAKNKRSREYLENERAARAAREEKAKIEASSAENELQKIKKHVMEKHGAEFWYTTLVESGVMKQVKKSNVGRVLAHLPQHLHDRLGVIPG